MGGVFAAAHLYVYQWGKTRPPTTLTPEGLKCFGGFADRDLYEYAPDVATRWVVPKGDQLPVRFKQHPYSDINGDFERTAQALRGGVANGMLLLLTESSEEWLGDLMEAKLAAVEKRILLTRWPAKCGLFRIRVGKLTNVCPSTGARNV